jgi:hypothetical protein
MAHEMSVILTDEEYAELSTEAAKSGKPVEALVHDILAQRPYRVSSLLQPVTSRTFTEQQYREGKVLTLPTRELLAADEAVERERRAQLLRGGTPASDMVIEDRGPR